MALYAYLVFSSRNLCENLPIDSHDLSERNQGIQTNWNNAFPPLIINFKKHKFENANVLKPNKND